MLTIKIMRKELEELKQTVLLLSNTLLNQNLVNETGSELLNLIELILKPGISFLNMTKTDWNYQNLENPVSVESLNMKKQNWQLLT